MKPVEAVLQALFVEIDPVWRSVLLFLIGATAAVPLCLWIMRLTPPADETAPPDSPEARASSPWFCFLPLVGWLLCRGRRRYQGYPFGIWGVLVEIAAGLVFAGFAYAVLELDCQFSPEVRPEPLWRYARLAYHLILICLLIAATGTDFREYVIPDRITLSGIVIGVAGAALSGQLQIVHVWTDWSHELPELRGPYIPAWLDQYRHLHGLTWSLCGMAVGAGITWLVRVLSIWILHVPALGLGDVTLMAMIGSFMGWQPVLVVFFLAPLCGAAVAVSLRVITGTTFVPYGPYLSIAAVVVLFTWKWLWWPTRLTFGDPMILATLGSVAAAAFVLLLGLVRVYRAIPGKRRPDNSVDADATDPPQPIGPVSDPAPRGGEAGRKPGEGPNSA